MHSETLIVSPEIAAPRRSATLVDVLRDRATSLRDKVAFRFVREAEGPVEQRTYRELFERASAIAAELQTRAASGDRVLMVYPPGLEFVEAFFGCMLAGVVAVPTAAPGRRRPGAPLAAIRAASSPKLVLTSSTFVDEIDWREALGRSSRELPRLSTDQVSTDRQRDWRKPSLEAEDIAFLQYTSGSTSSPKGVMLTHANLLANSALIQQGFGTNTESRGVFWLPLYHDMGLIGGVLQPLFCGGTSTLLAAAAFLQRPALWLEEISRMRATISGAPDFAYDLCARRITADERRHLDLSSWQVAFTGAERVRVPTLERFAEAFGPCGFRAESFFPCYGLAEATLMVSGGPRGRRPTVLHVSASSLAEHKVDEVAPEDPASRALSSCGVCLTGQQVLVVDPDSRRLCDAQSVGEIWVAGPSVAQGYFENPARTAESFGGYLADSGAGPYLRTGDLGFIRDGQLYVTGRLKDLLIIRGRNFYPDDIEQSVLGAHPALRLGCCVAIAVDDGEVERLVIVQEVEPRSRGIDTAAALQAIHRAVTAQHEVEVDTIVLVKAGEIPRTSSGKPRRSACRDRHLANEMAVVASWKAQRDAGIEALPESIEPMAPRDVSAGEIETWLTQRIAGRLGLPTHEIRPTTPFLEFGMGSLDAVELAAGLEKWLGRRLSPTALYNHPNIAALSKWLATPLPTASETADGATDSAAATAIVPTLDPAQCLAEIAQQTDDELAAFIQAEMAKISGPDA